MRRLGRFGRYGPERCDSTAAPDQQDREPLCAIGNRSVAWAFCYEVVRDGGMASLRHARCNLVISEEVS